MKSIRWIGLFLLIASFGMAAVLPVWTSFENGPIENAQVICLAVGTIFAAFFAAKTDPSLRWFWIAVIPVWVAMCLRELSWGAVFLDPLSDTDHGLQFSSSALWYKPYVKPALIAAALFCCVSFYIGKGFVTVKNMVRAGKFPFVDIGLFILCMVVSAGTEGHLGVSLGNWGEPQVLEEAIELAAYIFLVSAQARVALAMRRTTL